MEHAVEATSVIASKDGVIVVKLTCYGRDGFALPQDQQPLNCFQVWRAAGPDPRMILACPSSQEAWDWVDESAGASALEEGEIDDEFLLDAFSAQPETIGSLADVPIVVANTEIIDREQVALRKQFVNRWLICKKDEDLTPLRGASTNSKSWRLAQDLCSALPSPGTSTLTKARKPRGPRP